MKITLNRDKALENSHSLNYYYSLLDDYFHQHQVSKVATSTYTANHLGFLAKAHANLKRVPWFLRVVET